MWFERMTKAVEQRDYQGHYIVRKGEQTLAYHLQHSYKQKQSKEHLFQLDQQAVELISDQQSVLQMQAMRRGSSFEQLLPGSPFANFASMQSQQLAQFYQFELLSQQRVAGWQGIVLLLTGDKMRHSYQIWLEEKSALPLKVQVISPSGDLLEEYRFVQLEILPIGEFVSFTSHLDSQQAMSLSFPKQINNKPQSPPYLPVAWKPTFFKLLNYERTTQQNLSVDGFHYGDGINHFSVFISKKQQSISGQMAQSGASYGIIFNKGAFQVTVMGELPEATINQIAQQLEIKLP